MFISYSLVAVATGVLAMLAHKSASSFIGDGHRETFESQYKVSLCLPPQNNLQILFPKICYFCGVRVFSLILSLYIAFSACYPCVDSTICVDEVKSGAEVSLSNHEHSPTEIDFCSPFCICNCCTSQITHPGDFHFDVHNKKIADNNSKIRLDYPRSVSYTIWQPPKLS